MDDSIQDTFFTSTKPAADSPRQLAIRFTGSGSEYFRIWIVNMLLILVTLGIYYPWAKVRKLRYFYGNTVVDGEALGFHADTKKMFKGYALVAVLFACYSLAGSFSTLAALVALLLIAALWPALFKSSMRFRMANTSWRGMRFRFTGTTPDAYKALLPLFGLGALVVALPNLQAEGEMLPEWLTLTLSVAVLGASVLIPWLFQRLKAFQHNHYALAQEQTAFSAGAWSFYVLGSKVVLLALTSLAGVSTLMAITGGNIGLLALGVPLMLLAYALIFAFSTSRFQNLVWNHTASQHLQFHSDLALRPLLFLYFKNFLLMLFTLGLYWPFAAVAISRMRLECVAITSSIDVAQLMSGGMPADGDAAGDAAGDFLGIDLGL
ncbi:MAG: YjgN family protein [Rhodoferax sp.]|nr:YjgN family protein [Rhodoferax sp.]